jgi:hypothetical protein
MMSRAHNLSQSAVFQTRVRVGTKSISRCVKACGNRYLFEFHWSLMIDRPRIPFVIPLQYPILADMASRSINAMSDKPIILVVRDKQEWPFDDFMTLFAEEGYETRDVDMSSLSELMDNFGSNSDLWPDMGAIGTRPYYKLIQVFSNMVEPFLKALVLGLGKPLKSLVIYEPPIAEALKTDIFSKVPTVLHLPSIQEEDTDVLNSAYSIRTYVYQGQKPGFANRSSPNYDKAASGIAYTRTLKHLRERLGPLFDLEKVLPSVTVLILDMG